MILSGQSIRNRHIFTPFSERAAANGMSYGLGPAGYDVRLGVALDLMPGGFLCAPIIEHMKMPRDLIGVVHDKSTLARLGLSVQNTIIEPGWHGILAVEIHNAGPERVRLPAGSPIAQIIFHQTDLWCEPYEGKYQGQTADAIGAKYEWDRPLRKGDMPPCPDPGQDPEVR